MTKFINSEFLRFISHESAGVQGFTQMPAAWPDVVAKVQAAATLQRTADVGAVAEAANRYSAATLNVKAVSGRVLYVRFHPVTHAFSFEPTLAVVPDDVALKEMSGAKLLQAASNN